MRGLVSTVLAGALASTLLTASPAAAVTGFDSAYAGESAFVTLRPGESNTFQVFFQNRGTLTWTRGTATQVDLAACRADKVTCNAQDATELPWNDGWLSDARYATHTQLSVAPGQIAAFAYGVRAPLNAAPGTYRFNGDLVRSTTGERIHPEGYFHDATLVGPVGGTGLVVQLAPADDTNRVRTSHTVTATLTVASGQPVRDVLVRFTVTRVRAAGEDLDVVESASRVTGATGQASFTYRGPSFAATDSIRACADLDRDGACPEPGEPADGAVKRWVR
ncbi:MAG: hypothetical protein ACRDF0_08055 [Candidatus Limnocylindria bacterium]